MRCMPTTHERAPEQGSKSLKIYGPVWPKVHGVCTLPTECCSPHEDCKGLKYRPYVAVCIVYAVCAQLTRVAHQDGIRMKTKIGSV